MLPRWTGSTKRVSDAGFRPLTFEATRSEVCGKAIVATSSANFVIKTANPQAGEAGDFNFPMEFSSADGTWQLTRRDR